MNYANIIATLLIMLSSQVNAKDWFLCGPPELPCSAFLPEVAPDCVGKSPDTLVPVKYPQEVDNQTCPTQCNAMNRIYDNCFIDKIKDLDRNLILTVRRSCERIACNPTFFQRLIYK